jgi:isopropylmalate/homocitrate/citramalate synthase
VAHTTVNAIGERIGNAAFEEVALILEVLYGKRLGLKYEKLYELSKTVEKLSKVSMPPHKPIVGEGAFKVESGIVASWLLEVLDSNPMVLFPFHWSLVGQPPPQIVLGKKSGKDSIVYKLKQMNVTASDEVALKILMDVKLESIRLKRPLSDEEFQNIMKKYL